MSLLASPSAVGTLSSHSFLRTIASEEMERWDSLTPPPDQKTLEEWRAAQKNDEGIWGAGKLDEQLVALATVAGTEIRGASFERELFWRYGAAGQRLARMPVWTYGADLEKKWGDGVWTDGLHVWVSVTSLAKLRHAWLDQDAYDGLEEGEPVTPLTSALLMAAASSLPGSSCPKVETAEAQAQWRPSRRWSDVRAALSTVPNGPAVLEGWPETGWSDDEVACFAAQTSLSPEDEHRLEGWWQAALTVPLSQPVWPLGTAVTGTPSCSSNSAAWRREVEVIWSRVEQAFALADPERYRIALRWLDPLLETTENPIFVYGWATRFYACKQQWSSYECDKEHKSKTMIAAFGEWSRSARYTGETRETAIRVFASFAPDLIKQRHALAGWLGLLAEIRDGRFPHELQAYRIPWEGYLGFLTAESRRAWFRLTIQAAPHVLTPERVWTCAHDEKTAGWLLDAGVSVRVSAPADALREAGGTTPLHRAVHRWSPDAVRRILAAGADAWAVDKSGKTVLASARHPDTVRLLVRLGLSVTAKHPFTGRTPLHEAAAGGYPKKEATLRALLEEGADPNACDADGETPLSILLDSTARGSWGGALALLLERTEGVSCPRAPGSSLLTLLLKGGLRIEKNKDRLSPDEFLRGLDRALAAGIPVREDAENDPIVLAARMPHKKVAVGALIRLLDHPEGYSEKSIPDALKQAVTPEAKELLGAWQFTSALREALDSEGPSASHPSYRGRRL